MFDTDFVSDLTHQNRIALGPRQRKMLGTNAESMLQLLLCVAE